MRKDLTQYCSFNDKLATNFEGKVVILFWFLNLNEQYWDPFTSWCFRYPIVLQGGCNLSAWVVHEVQMRLFKDFIDFPKMGNFFL